MTYLNFILPYIINSLVIAVIGALLLFLGLCLGLSIQILRTEAETLKSIDYEY